MTRDRFDLTGKVALVAGASRGIGSEIAVALGEYGAHVIALSRGEGGCDETLDRIRAVGGEGEAKVCHIGKMEQIVKETYKDGCVNKKEALAQCVKSRRSLRYNMIRSTLFLIPDLQWCLKPGSKWCVSQW